MRPPLLGVASLLAVSLTWAPVLGAQDLGAPLPRSWFALDAEFAGMLPVGEWTPRFLMRARAGYSRIADWRFWDATLTAEHLTTNRTAFGVFGNLSSIPHGWSIGLGAHLSTEARPGATLAVGYSVFQIEAQVLWDEPTQVWLGLGLRIPLGSIAYSVWAPPLRYRMPRLRGP